MKPTFLRPLCALLLCLGTPALAQPDGEFDALFGEPDTVQAGASTADPGAADQEEAETIPVEPAPPKPAAAPPRRVIDEIVVTATKREASVRDIPGSITALAGEDLERANAQDAADVIKLVPGVTLQQGDADSSSISVRGVSSEAALGQPTGIFIGEAPFTDPFLPRVSPDLNVFDMATVEILKGPQGTLFGGSALNGAIRYVPVRPDFQAWQGKAFASYSTTREGGSAPVFGGAINAPLGGTAGLRLVAIAREVAGVIDEDLRGEDDVDSREQFSGRLLAGWAPTDALSLDFMYLRQETVMDDVSNADNFDGDLQRDNTAKRGLRESEFDLINLDLNWSLPIGDLVVSANRLTKSLFADLDLTYAVAPDGADSQTVLETRVPADVDGLTGELRLASNGDGPWQWLVGAFAQDYHADEVTENSSPGGAIDTTLDVTVDAREQALFGELTRSLVDRLDLTLGLRLFRTHVHGISIFSGNAAILLCGSNPCVSDDVIRDSGLNPKLALRFDISEAHQLYAAVSRGFRFGGIQIIASSATNPVPPTYKSDTIWNHEIGLRSDLFGRSLLVDATAFHIRWTDPQVQQIVEETAGIYVDNVGGAKITGLEAAVQWLPPVAGLSVNFSGAYIDSQTTAPFDDSDGNTVPPGFALAHSPDLKTHLSVDYRRVIGMVELAANIAHGYTGRAFNNVQHTHEILDFHNFDARLSVGLPNWRGAPELSLVGTNLSDERAITNVVEVAQANVFYVRPRTLTLRLNARF